MFTATSDPAFILRIIIGLVAGLLDLRGADGLHAVSVVHVSRRFLWISLQCLRSALAHLERSRVQTEA